MVINVGEIYLDGVGNQESCCIIGEAARKKTALVRLARPSRNVPRTAEGRYERFIRERASYPLPDPGSRSRGTEAFVDSREGAE